MTTPSAKADGFLGHVRTIVPRYVPNAQSERSVKDITGCIDISVKDKPAVRAIMEWLGDFYKWVWFHSEFLITPVNRRPWTFCMRDWLYTHIQTFLALVGLFYAGMITLSIWHGTAATITGSLCSLLLAHLVWGTKWIENEQEYPEYLGEVKE